MPNKHESYDLAQMQSLPLIYKVIMTKQRIKGWYDAFNGDVYVSVSGGKDSKVLAHIVREMYPDVPLVFINTGLEWESVKNIGIQSDYVLIPKMNFLNVISKYGYPVISKEVAQKVYEYRQNPNGCVKKRFNGEYENKAYSMEKYKWLLDAPFRISHMCCNIMKKAPSKKFEKETNLKPFIATMACESRLRKTAWLRYGCNAFESSRPKSQPLSFWTEKDILQYIKENNIEIADVYGEITNDLTLTGMSRTGCTFCMFGIKQENEKFLKLKEIEPKKYDYIMRGGAFDNKGMWVPAPDENGNMGLGYKFVIDWLNEHGNLNIKY